MLPLSLVVYAPMVVDIGCVRSELLQAICTKPLGIRCGFASVLNLNFGFPNFEGRGAPMVVSIGGIRLSISELPQAIYTKPNDWFCCRFEVKFWFLQLAERGPLWGWAFVVSDGASVTSYRSHYKALT